jgi:hypothetical protein
MTFVGISERAAAKTAASSGSRFLALEDIDEVAFAVADRSCVTEHAEVTLAPDERDAMFFESPASRFQVLCFQHEALVPDREKVSGRFRC